MCDTKTEYEKQIAHFQKTKRLSAFEKYPQWIIERLQKYAEREQITKETASLMAIKKGIPVEDLKTILNHK